MIRFIRSVAALAMATLAVNQASADPIYATSLESSSNVTPFGSGSVIGEPDGGGLFLGSTFDPPVALGTLTVGFATPLGNGPGTDLTVVEIVSSPIETFNVEVSSDGITFTLLGEFSATNNQIDFGAFVDPVAFVRLTNTSLEASADIDALVGNYAAAAVPEPSAFVSALIGAGLGTCLLTRRRMRDRALEASA